MKLWIFLLCSSLVVKARADHFSNDPSRIDNETFMRQGRLISVSLSPGNPLRIFVVGREEAKLDLSKMKLTVRRLNPYPAQEMRVSRDGDFYTVVNDEENPLKEIEITTSVNKNTESFQFNIKNTKP